jgi:DnaK suppressor protein
LNLPACLSDFLYSLGIRSIEFARVNRGWPIAIVCSSPVNGKKMKTNLLTQCDTGLFHDLLEKEASELRGALRNRAGVTLEPVAEECERTVLAGQRELTVELVDRGSRRLREVETALRRLAEGGYGLCTDCDEPISVRRLTAIPWAGRCVPCQEAADREAGSSIPGQTHKHTPSEPFGYRRFGSAMTSAGAGQV